MKDGENISLWILNKSWLTKSQVAFDDSLIEFGEDNNKSISQVKDLLSIIVPFSLCKPMNFE